jgi:hypothetical protein
MTVAVNEMLLQDYTGTVKELPAWPEGEPVHFRLHLPEGKVVERIV